MEQGELGTIKVGEHELPNPLGLSTIVSDADLLVEILNDPGLQSIDDRLIDTYLNHEHDPVTGKCIVSEEGHRLYEQITDLGRKIALRQVRTIMQLAGIDIADRPISIEPVAIQVAFGTKWHVVTAVVPLAEQQ